MRLENYIADLLFRHDCVIVPRLGAFLLRNKPSQISDATQMFRPPHKDLGFNASLLESDGILEGYIVKVNKINYTQAKSIIEDGVLEWKSRLAKGERIHLEQIGKLYQSAKGNIEFLPALEQNFDIDSFGLGIFHTNSLRSLEKKRKEAHEVSLSRSKPEKKEEVKVPEVSRTSKSKTAFHPLRWAAVLLPLAALTIIGVTQNSELQSMRRTAEFFGPVVFSQPHAEPVVDSQTELNLKQKSVLPFGGGLGRAEAPVVSNENPTTDVDKSVEEVVSIPVEKPVVLEQPTAAKNTVSSPSYHVIVGAFAERSNGERMIQKLRSEGYNASEANGSGLMRVSAAQFSSKQEAMLFIQNHLGAQYKGAWVYRS
jgi:cell division septation protein DedD